MTAAIDTNLLTELGLSKQEPVRQAKSELGEDAFLKLMIAQMQNQDPMKPMENGEFISQLAQFQSVSGIDDLRKSVEQMATAMQSNQALQASSLVGRWIETPSSKSQLWDEIGMAGSVDVPEGASNVIVTISDNGGQVVKQIALGDPGVGTKNYSWDGLGDDGTQFAAGEYSVEATATIGGAAESLETNAIVPVDSVYMGKTGEPMTVNTSLLGKVQLSEVKQIM